MSSEIRRLGRTLFRGCAAACLATAAVAQEQEPDDYELRLRRLEEHIGILEEEIERNDLGDLIPVVGESEWGMGPAASKIYSAESGLSIGGYGEFLFQERSGRSDVWDALRSVLYFGYRFDEKWLFNSEIEIEHGTTSDSSGTTTSDGSVSLEFGYVDYLHSDSANFRGGLVLVPMGFINELHEPTTFLSANRPQTETRIIPTTWRANGIGVFGDAGEFAYKSYVVNALDGEEFDSKGLRGGRQKGNRSAADDVAWVTRVDWVEHPGLTIGGSVYVGDTGQDGSNGAGDDIPDLRTTIVELHAEYRTGPWVLRGLYAMADVDDAGDFNTNTGENLADELEGHYLEAGYDVASVFWPDSGQSLTPFIRYEGIDTQSSLPSGFAPDDEQDDEIITYGIQYKPVDNVVLKLDFDDWDGDGDSLNFLIGYVF